MDISNNYSKQIDDYIQDSFEFVDPIFIVNSLYIVFCKFKDQHRLTQCSGCKRFKIAGTKCRNETCIKYNATHKCIKCKRSFVKQGNHKCWENIVLPKTFDNSLVNKDTTRCNDLDDAFDNIQVTQDNKTKANVEDTQLYFSAL